VCGDSWIECGCRAHYGTMPPLLGGRNTTFVGLRPGYSGLLATLLNLSLLATVEADQIGCGKGVHEGWCSKWEGQP
jgi:hypothetical protein